MKTIQIAVLIWLIVKPFLSIILDINKGEAKASGVTSSLIIGAATIIILYYCGTFSEIHF